MGLLSCSEHDYVIKCDLTEIDTNPHQKFSFVFNYNNKSKVLSQYHLLTGVNQDYQGGQSWFEFLPNGLYPFGYEKIVVTKQYTLSTILCSQSNDYCNQNEDLKFFYFDLLKGVESLALFPA